MEAAWSSDGEKGKRLRGGKEVCKEAVGRNGADGGGGGGGGGAVGGLDPPWFTSEEGGGLRINHRSDGKQRPPVDTSRRIKKGGTKNWEKGRGGFGRWLRIGGK